MLMGYSDLHLPGDIDTDAAERDVPDHVLPTVLKATEKRALGLLSDWPWIAPANLGELLGIRRSRLSEAMRRLEGLGLAADLHVEGRRRLALTDRGLALLARRDRSTLGAARKRWSVAPLDADAPLDWRNVSGGRSRQLLRFAEHTDSVHWFAAVLERQAHSRSRQVVQLDPPRRASRYFRHDGRVRSVHPDAFGVLRRGTATWPFFLEWERRAVRPVTMAARIAPYLRYYSSDRFTDDHGSQPIGLVVFEDEIVQTHFLHVARQERQEMERTGVSVPQEPAGGGRAVGTRLADNRRRGTRLRLREPALSILSPITQSPLSRGDGTALVVKKVSPVDNHIIDSLVPQETIGGG